MSNIKTILITLAVLTYSIFRLVSYAVHTDIQLKNTVSRQETSTIEMGNKLKQTNEAALKTRETLDRQIISMKTELNNKAAQYEASAAEMADKIKRANEDAVKYRELLANQVALNEKIKIAGAAARVEAEKTMREARQKAGEEVRAEAEKAIKEARQTADEAANKSALKVRGEYIGQIGSMKARLNEYEISTADMANKLKKANEDAVKYREAFDRQAASVKARPVNKAAQDEALITDMAERLKKANEDAVKYREALDKQSALNEKIKAEADAARTDAEAEKAINKARAAAPPPGSGDAVKVREELTKQIVLLKVLLEKYKASGADAANKINKAGDDTAKYREALARQIVFSEKAKAEADAAKAEVEKVITAQRSAAPAPVNEDAVKVRKELSGQIVSLKMQLDNTTAQYDTYSSEMTKKLKQANEEALRARGELARQAKQAGDDTVKTRGELTGQIASLKTQLKKYEASALEMADKLNRTNDELTQHRQALDRQIVLTEKIKDEADTARVEADKAVNQARQGAVAFVNESAVKAREELAREIASLKTQLKKNEASAALTAVKLNQANEETIKTRAALEAQVASLKTQLKNMEAQREAAAAEMANQLKKANDDASRAREAFNKQIVLNEKAKAASEAAKAEMIKSLGEANKWSPAKVMADKAKADATKAEVERVINTARSAAINEDAIKVRRELAGQVDSLKAQLNDTAAQYEADAANMADKLTQANEDALMARGELARQTKKAREEAIKIREEFAGQIASMKAQLNKYEIYAVEMADKFKQANEELVQHREVLDRQIILNEKAKAAGEAAKFEMIKGLGESKQAAAAKGVADKARADAETLLGQTGMSPDYR